ncbi:Hypothetical predicted protein [Olea europaea subsp. europaea]|uniref:SHSP domain-containing protein n=1 Tax=Olea europaea subsp. europaea TaxID=158383 RepID=A0A8S0P7L9_OLEEU|nr:Hypothetical predicted protein [Olea europaea subsp. europaea]
MKVHPVPRCTLRYDIASVLAQANNSRYQKLRRLPHIFPKVLELPFQSDAIVSVEETPDSFTFSAATDDIDSEVRANAVEIYPGVTKIVVILGNGAVDLSRTEFELDMLRFRLPASTLPELASVEYGGGELVVTVPKGGDVEENGGDDIGVGGLVLVQ